MFLHIANTALEEGKFPHVMKEARLVLLPKPVKNKGDPIMYRPISLLNVFAKVLEAMIEHRLKTDIDLEEVSVPTSTVSGEANLRSGR